MASILRFFDFYAPLIYLILAIWGAVAVRRLWRAWRESHSAVFGLERELAQRRISQGIVLIVLIVLLLVGELVFDSILAPSMPALTMLQTPTANPLAVPTETLLPFITPEATMSPAVTVETSGGCIPGQIMITFPEPATEIRGQVMITGSANVPNFGFYKYEMTPLGLDQWSTISAGREVVQDGDLGRWDTSQLTPGDYLLRLVVTDNQGNSFPACVIPVRVLAP
jgi:hypothetical protein